MSFRFIGVIAAREKYISPAEIRMYVTENACTTRAECVQEVWKMFIDEAVFDTEAFAKFTLSASSLSDKFLRFAEEMDDDEREEREEEFMTDKEELKQIELTEQEFVTLLHEFFDEDFDVVFEIKTILVQ